MPNNWCLQTVVLEKPLELPWTARKSNQPILREINPKYSLEGLMLKLKLQYLGHLMWTHRKSPWCWERLRTEGEEGEVRGWDGWIASPMQWTWTWANFGRWCEEREAWRATVQGVAKESDMTGRLNKNNSDYNRKGTKYSGGQRMTIMMGSMGTQRK